MFFFFNDTATTEIYTLSLHDALPICSSIILERFVSQSPSEMLIAPNWGIKNHEFTHRLVKYMKEKGIRQGIRSEEHTSELQSRQYLVCRLLLEKKKNTNRLTMLVSAR